MCDSEEKFEASEAIHLSLIALVIWMSEEGSIINIEKWKKFAKLRNLKNEKKKKLNMDYNIPILINLD